MQFKIQEIRKKANTNRNTITITIQRQIEIQKKANTNRNAETNEIQFKNTTNARAVR